MRIKVLTTFLDGRDKFHADDVRTVSDEDGTRFISNGWAVAEGAAPSYVESPASVDLKVDGARHAVKETQHG